MRGALFGDVADDRGGQAVRDRDAICSPQPLTGVRPDVRGKFIFAGEEKLYVRGVTYGAFRPDEAGREYTDLARIDSDFAQMAASGFNAVRIPHTMPPRQLLDIAFDHGLWVMAGLSCEQYVGYLTDRRRAPDIRGEMRARVRSCAGHPALLCYALGNEIPGSVARWLGARRIERYLRGLYESVKEEDPGAIVTYVNYPTTEYLRLDFLDLLAFNVYLEDSSAFEAYLGRLHHLAGDRPLLMSEVGLDSLRHGEAEQARFVSQQISTTFESGCAGAFVFSWTDEWHRGEEEVYEWRFGLTDRQRRPKPALRAVGDACRDVPFSARRSWKRVSVVVCAFNAEATIADTLDGLGEVAYPNYEVIVVDDGSTDATGSIAQNYDVNLISTPNRGLSSARNTGLWRSTGEIVAYLDADARPDPHWLQYLAAAFDDPAVTAVGGPNIAPPGDGEIAECIANAPGNPTHVMLSDRIAEHIPGCNMAFRREALIALEGFDKRFRVAGDDVDICWRIQDAGGTIGFSPAAVVWHHRRSSLHAFIRQQIGYGAAEGLLEEKWPDRHTDSGRISWSGRIYGAGHIRRPRGKTRIYQGPWGTAPFQSIYEHGSGTGWTLTATAEWRLLVAALTVVAALGLVWTPLLAAAPAALLSGLVMLAQSWVGAAHGSFSRPRISLRLLTTALFVLQPLARWRGRLHTQRQIHSANARLAVRGLPLLRRRLMAHWSEVWREPATWLRGILGELHERGAIVRVGSDYDEWDLDVRGGRLGGGRLLAAFEDNGSGNQYLRFRGWPHPSRSATAAALFCWLVAAGGAFDGNLVVAAVFATAGALLAAAITAQCAAALARLWAAVPACLQSTDD